MAQALTNKFTEQLVDILVDTNTALGSMVILNPKSQYLISLTNNLSLLFDTNSKTFPHIAVKKFKIHFTKHLFCLL